MAPKKAQAVTSSKPAKSGGKQKKKKWSKGKQKEKVNNMVMFDKATYERVLQEAPKYKLITPSVLSDRLRLVCPNTNCLASGEWGIEPGTSRSRESWTSWYKISGSLARKAIKELMARGLIRLVSAHSSQQIYTRATYT